MEEDCGSLPSKGGVCIGGGDCGGIGDGEDESGDGVGGCDGGGSGDGGDETKWWWW